MNADVTRSALRSLAAGLLLALALSACTSVSEDYQQRQNLVYVPSHAQPVDKVRWDHMRNIRPLNERMILMDVRRQPHLLVLAKTCHGLRRNSILVLGKRLHFDPQRDAIGVVNPGRIQHVATCVPDALYAIEDEDVDELKASV